MLRPEFLVLGSIIRAMNCQTIVEVGVEIGDACQMLATVAHKNSGHYFGYDMWARHGVNNQYPQRGSKEAVTERLQMAHIPESCYTLKTDNLLKKGSGRKWRQRS